MSKVMKGEHNPRYYILLPVGAGNVYCRNCEQLRPTGPSDWICNVFTDKIGGIPSSVILNVSERFGPTRCKQCKDAAAALQTVKEECRKEGADGEYYRRTQGKTL
jgi:hypothetical protein